MLGEDKQAAMQNIVKLVKNLDGIYNSISRMNVLMKVFFDSKYKEIYNLVKDYPDKSILQILKKVDPAHISTYEQGL
jgi:predicted transcriptional regulator